MLGPPAQVQGRDDAMGSAELDLVHAGPGGAPGAQPQVLAGLHAKVVTQPQFVLPVQFQPLIDRGVAAVVGDVTVIGRGGDKIAGQAVIPAMAGLRRQP